jgi:protein-tyrosine-phosphatase
LAAAARAGVDLETHRSTVFSADDVRRADLVVAMSPGQARGIRWRFGRPASSVIVLGDLDPLVPETRGIRDPWRNPPEVFDESYERITRCVRELAQVLRIS